MFAYCITNSINGMQYIGITSRRNPLARWQAHKKAARKTRPEYAIARAVKKHGDEAFVFEVILCLIPTGDNERDWKTLCAVERALIAQYETFTKGYNATMGGEGVFGRKMGEAELARHKAIRKGRKLHPDHVKKSADGLRRAYAANPELRARHNRPEHMARMTAARGELWKNPDYRAKMAAISSARVIKDSTREKLRAIKSGKIRTPEAIAAMRAGCALRDQRWRADPEKYARMVRDRVQSSNEDKSLRKLERHLMALHMKEAA